MDSLNTSDAVYGCAMLIVALVLIVAVYLGWQHIKEANPDSFTSSHSCILGTVQCPAYIIVITPTSSAGDLK